MDWQFILFLSLVPVTIILVIFSMVLVLRWRKTERGRSLLALHGIVLLWLVFNTIELLATSRSMTLLFAKFTYVFIILTPVAWLYFSLIYTGFGKRARRAIPWLCIVPVISIIGVWTNPLHHLMWQENSFRQVFGFVAISHQYGPLFYVHSIYSYLLFFAGVGVIIYSIYNGPQLFRRQLNAFMIGATLVAVYNLFHVLKIFPLQKDFSPILLALPGLALVFSMIRYRLLEIQPMSRGLLLDLLKDGIVILDQEQRIVDVNLSFLKILGMDSHHPPIGDRFEIHFPRWISYVRLIKNEGVVNSSFKWSTVVEDESRVYKILVKETRAGMIVTFHEITATEELIDQARELASRDPLTGVLNRREFFKRGMVALNLAIRHKRPLSIMILDIDYFKRFNDHYGHQLGDDVLVVFGKYCKANFRKSDILGRYGGDEFIALLPETSVEQAANLARRINNEVKKIWKDDCGVNSQLGMSIGLAEVSELDQVLTLEKLIDRADRALYTAKKIGRDKYSIWQRNKVIS